MAIPDFYLEPANPSADLEALRAVRTKVFVEEQGITPEIEFDHLDPICHHLLARDSLGQPIGTARLTPDGRIGRMAVLAEYRGRGVGASLLRGLLEKARHLGIETVTAHAQIAALGFYQRLGFAVEGEVFSEAGIPHQTVSRQLPPLSAPQRPLRTIAASVEAVRLESIEAIHEAKALLIAGASRQLSLYSRELDTSLYAQPALLENLKWFVLRSRMSKVRIIIQQPEALRNQYHPLVDMTQKLPSYFELRTPTEANDLQTQSAYLLNDAGGYLFRLMDQRYDGHWSPNLPWRNRQLAEQFEQVWQRSRICNELRALSL